MVTKLDAYAIQAMARKAVDLLTKLAADRPSEFSCDDELHLLRLTIDDERFRKLAAAKIDERNL